MSQIPKNLVVQYKETCGGCPSAWLIQTKNERGKDNTYFVHYRNGLFRVETHDVTIFSKAVGGPLDGCMSASEMQYETKNLFDWRLFPKC
jgi:hypothetical protein